MSGLQEAFDRIGSALEAHLFVSHAAGAAVALTDREEILGVAVRGLADAAAGTAVRPETRFEIGSISKSFAALLCLQEAEEGRLDLHARVNELLPWADIPEPFGVITLHHLLTHTGGLVIGTEDAPTGLGAAANLRSQVPTFGPGDRFWYSNDAYKLVGMVLERVSGSSIQDLLHRRVLVPLGMTSSVAAITDETRLDLATGYEPMYTDRPPQLTHPLMPATWLVSNTADGSIVSTVIDMCAYARLILNRGNGPQGPLLSERAFTDWITPWIADPDEAGFGYGYGLSVGTTRAGRRWIKHTGGMVGYTASFVVEQDSGLGCVLLQNGGGDKTGVVTFALDAMRACLSGDPLPEPWRPRDPEEVPNADAFAGTYRGDRRSFRIEVVDHARLRLHVGPVAVVLQQDPLESPGDTFLVPHPSLERFPLRFARDPDGQVVEAFHGNEWLRGEAWRGPDPVPHPAAWDAYPGLYRSNDPWSPVLRVLLRKERLALQWPWEGDQGPGDELTPVEDGWFAVGEPWQPQRIRFDRIVEGKAVIAEFNGGRWFRSFEE